MSTKQPEQQLLRFYFDYKSPFSYLATFGIYELQDQYHVKVQWLPFQFNVKESFGLPESRSEVMWRKVRNAYLDARRFANQLGIKIYGPQKAFDSTRVLSAGLFVQKYGGEEAFRKFSDFVFERFFLRKLDIEDETCLLNVVREQAGVICSQEQFHQFCTSEGPQMLSDIEQHFAARDGVFGVPSFVLAGEMFFGNDRLDWVKKRLDALGARKCPATKL